MIFIATATVILLEIVKILIPAIIVFVTAYTILKTYLGKQYQMKLLETKESVRKTTIPLKLQAYERLSLLCERISPPNLILRLKTPGMKSEDLHMAILIAVQQEFDHNISQQVYVSDNLWSIIKYARQHVINSVSVVISDLEQGAPASVFADRLIDFYDESIENPLDTAQKAIRREASLLL
ncbi:MAG: hypothetical protein EA362_06630 [Saprospirales bacterium]|nr:MAG: hypothetical protein EA362_06630 [Saprospirales bacterium]